MFDQVTTTGIAYANYTYQAIATSTSTTLEFDSQNDPSWNYLDDVVVTPVPEPTSFCLATAGLTALVASLCTRSPRKS
jgi:hypothetical protein